jgi:hypothetical protein
MAKDKNVYVYVGDPNDGPCKAGEVEFNEHGKVTVMPYGESVEVSDALAAKLAANSHFMTPEAFAKFDAEKPKAKKPKK